MRTIEPALPYFEIPFDSMPISSEKTRNTTLNWFSFPWTAIFQNWLNFIFKIQKIIQQKAWQEITTRLPNGRHYKQPLIKVESFFFCFFTSPIVLIFHSAHFFLADGTIIFSSSFLFFLTSVPINRRRRFHFLYRVFSPSSSVSSSSSTSTFHPTLYRVLLSFFSPWFAILFKSKTLSITIAL